MGRKRPDIQGFRDWLLARGRSPYTAYQYGNCVSLCLRDGHGVTGRLVGSRLAPKTKRANLAALRAWAKWTKDADLADVLDDLKLPPPERVTAKEPLTLEEWSALLDAIPLLDLTEATRNAVEMIALRGFRVGDVCRLSRSAVRRGAQTGILNYRGKSGRQINWTVRPFESQLQWFADQRNWSVVGELVAPDSEDTYRSARQRLYRVFPRLAAAIGVSEDELSPHRLRRTYAVHFLDQVRGDLEKLRQHMGWASIATAAQYVDHSRREELDALADSLSERVTHASQED